MTLPTRKFGVEVEFVGISRMQAQAAIVSAGVSCRVEHYGHAVPNQWKIVEDGSVVDNRGQRTGGELVSPPLSGETGLAQVQTVLRALAGAGATVNKTCGLHVHVDAADLVGADIARIFVNYRNAEVLVNQMMPRSRVNNTYCKAISGMYDFSAFIGRLQTAPGRDSYGSLTAPVLSEAHRFDRYHTVNLASFARHGTLEFRHHSGTVNATKVTNWIQFVLYFVQNAKTMNDPSVSSVASRPSTTTAGAAPVARRRGRQTNYAARRAMWSLLSQCSVRTVNIADLAQVSGYSPATVNVLLSGLRNRRQAGGTVVQIRTGTNYGVNRMSTARRYVRSVYVCRQDALDAWLGNTTAGSTIVGSHTQMRSTAMVQSTDTTTCNTVASLFASMPAELRGFYTERASDFGYDWA